MRGDWKVYIIGVLFLFYASAGKGQINQLGKLGVGLLTQGGEETVPETLAANKLSAFIFLGEDCLASQKYALQLKKLINQYQEEVDFYAVFLPDIAGNNHAEAYLANYGFNGKVLVDHHLKLTQTLGATITPEVFLVDQAQEVRYSGAIDNWYYALGKYRRVVTAHYLADAMDAILAGEQPAIERTQAIGCFINRNISQRDQ